MLRLGATALATIMVLAACSSSPAGTPGPGAGTPGAGTTQAPASLTPDTSLEDLFPDDLGGRPLEVRSASGASVAALFDPIEPADLNQFLGQMGATVDQMSLAFGFSLVPGASAGEFSGISIFALRVAGKPAGEIMTNLASVLQEDMDDAALGTATISGKNVTTISEPDDPEGAFNLYPSGDVVFMVGGTPSLVGEAFSKLP
jgi:hypothetical protein